MLTSTMITEYKAPFSVGHTSLGLSCIQQPVKEKIQSKSHLDATDSNGGIEFHPQVGRPLHKNL